MIRYNITLEAMRRAKEYGVTPKFVVPADGKTINSHDIDDFIANIDHFPTNAHRYRSLGKTPSTSNSTSGGQNSQ